MERGGSLGQLGEMQQGNSDCDQEPVSTASAAAPGAAPSHQSSQPLQRSFLWENLFQGIGNLRCHSHPKRVMSRRGQGLQDSQDVLLPPGEVLCTRSQPLQLVLRKPDHNQDLNEPCVCRTVLFQGKGRKLCSSAINSTLQSSR